MAMTAKMMIFITTITTILAMRVHARIQDRAKASKRPISFPSAARRALT
jgi:hypothetical protein